MKTIEWKDYNNKNGNCAYAEVEADGYEYELNAWRMDDMHNNTYKSNATGYKYAYSLDTTETFYPGGDCTGLTDGYTMTLDEAKEELEKAFKQRNKYREEWREDAENWKRKNA